MRKIVAASLAFTLALAVFAAVPPQKPPIVQAERLVAEKSYRLALDAYERVDLASLPDDERRWVEFRRADLKWRSAPGGDPTPVEEAERSLMRLLHDEKGADIRDRVWAEAKESLGDLRWIREERRDWHGAWQNYEAALDWWAGSRDIDEARRRYLAIIWKAAESPEQWNPYGYYGQSIPIEILRNAAEIAQSKNDQARAQYLIAINLAAQRSAESVEQTRMAFEAALAAGRSTEWYDDALYQYAQWLTTAGKLTQLDDGSWRIEADLEAGVETVRRLLTEFKRGETRYWDEASRLHETLTDTSLEVAVQNVFLPRSRTEFLLSWRNLAEANLTLTKVDLSRDLTRWTTFGKGTWLDAIETDGNRERFTWKRTLDAPKYAMGQERVAIERELTPGAWVLDARSGSEKSRALLLITDAAIVVRSSATKALMWVTSAESGEPLANTPVTVWTEHAYGEGSRREQQNGVTDADGLVEFPIKEYPRRNHHLLVVAGAGSRQVLSEAWTYPYHRDDAESWRMYATTDRPAYRPGETVQWKVTGRVVRGDDAMDVPAQREVSYEIFDPRGSSVKKGTLRLNSFGSAWDELPVEASMPLGEYRVTFTSGNRRIGNATLFRLEEYKLPEFRVSVTTADRDGKSRAFRLGDTIEATIEASYYFGGPVANASVEVLVRQRPYHRWWIPEREYDWYFENEQQHRSTFYGGEPIVKQTTLVTDAEGRATLRFETPASGGNDFEYQIEARVTDSSRREISAQSRVRVTRAPYAVDARPAHWIYRPGDSVEVTFRALDANDQPVVAEGPLTVTREEWREVWLDPRGNEVTGKQLETLRAASSFPPRPKPGEHGWVLKSRGYVQEKIAQATVRTDANGRAAWRFTPQREGYYRFNWASRPAGLEKPRPRDVVEASTTVWVATRDTTRLGYVKMGSVEVLLDQEAVKPGSVFPVMVVAPTAGRTLLFSVDGEEMISRQVIRMTGNVKLIELQLTDRHIPNVFLTATSVFDLAVRQDTKELIVPPVGKFLDVEVSADRDEAQPREEGVLTITTRDADGKPVAAEVSLGVVDESVYAIQSDYAGDPRRFFYNRKRVNNVRTSSSFAFRQYVRLVEGEDRRLIDERVLEEERRSRDGSGAAAGVAFDAVQEARAEAITVTASAPAVARQAANLAKSAAEPPPPPAAPPAPQMADQAGVIGGVMTDEPAVQVRSDFRSTVLWKPDVMTDATGRATVRVTWPDSLTTWRATARAVTTASQFGIDTSTTRTKKPLLVRLQAPRFFVVGDRTVVSAVVNNNTASAVNATVTLDATGLPIAGAASQTVAVTANGEARVDWNVDVRTAGTALLRVTARGGQLADAMERSYPIEEHGIEKLIAGAGKLAAGATETTVRVTLPAERRATTMFVQVAPSLGVTMLDALPYLLHFPYGCTEQTMSRFMPAVVVAKTLSELGIPKEAIAKTMFGGLEAASIPKIHATGKGDLNALDDLVREGLARLYDFQHGDGGWGWWKNDQSDRHMSAYVVWGLALSRDAGVAVRAGVLERGIGYLQNELVKEENNPDRQAWMLHALAATARGRAAHAHEKAAVENLWKKRDRLSSYGLGLFAIAAKAFADPERVATLTRNLENGAAVDRTPDASVVTGAGASGTALATAHWGARDSWWQWQDSPVESTSVALRALVAGDRSHRLVEPAMNWLVKNRRGAQWNNTRDTAMAILALAEYLKGSGELAGDLSYEVLVNGARVGERNVGGGAAALAPARFTVPADAIRDGANAITVRRRSGRGPLYIAAESRFFSLEEPVKSAGNEIFIRRTYERLAGRPTLLKGVTYDRIPMKDGDSIRSGERVDVVITVDVKNDYEYLLLEDLKPAGLEAVELVSGTPLYAKKLRASDVVGPSGRGAEGQSGRGSVAPGRVARTRPVEPDAIATQWVYQELRDRKVALFISRLTQGVWEIRYTLRAEVPGTFHALPVVGGAMYVPEIKGNSDEIRLRVEE